MPKIPVAPKVITPKNFRIVPCRLYHGPTGCTRGDFCHFIHAVGFEGILSISYFNVFRTRNPKGCILEA